MPLLEALIQGDSFPAIISQDNVPTFSLTDLGLNNSNPFSIV